MLVSLCNLAVPRETALLRIKLDSLEVFPVKLGAIVAIKSCTGLARDETRVYVLCADADVISYLAVLNLGDLSPVYFQRLPEIIDGHSVLIHQGRLFIASTGNDAVISYRMFEDRVANPSLAWHIPDDSGTHHDTHHVNSVALWKGDIVFSAFGLRTGQTWSTAVNGYIYNLSQGAMLTEGICQPHSLKEWRGDLYYCESARGRIAGLSSAGWEIGDYTRGMDFMDADTFAVGSSVGRKVSKSTGIINNPDDPGEQVGTCAVNLFRLSSAAAAERLQTISLADYGSEIYDLLSLRDVQPGGNTARPADLHEPVEEAFSVERVQELPGARREAATRSRNFHKELYGRLIKFLSRS